MQVTLSVLTRWGRTRLTEEIEGVITIFLTQGKWIITIPWNNQKYVFFRNFRYVKKGYNGTDSWHLRKSKKCSRKDNSETKTTLSQNNGWMIKDAARTSSGTGISRGSETFKLQTLEACFSPMPPINRHGKPMVQSAITTLVYLLFPQPTHCSKNGPWLSSE